MQAWDQTKWVRFLRQKNMRALGNANNIDEECQLDDAWTPTVVYNSRLRSCISPGANARMVETRSTFRRLELHNRHPHASLILQRIFATIGWGKNTAGEGRPHSIEASCSAIFVLLRLFTCDLRASLRGVNSLETSFVYRFSDFWSQPEVLNVACLFL